MKTIVIINRWQDDFADYGQLIDHFKHRIIYICDQAGSTYIKERARLPHQLYQVQNLNDASEMIAIMQGIINLVGSIDYLVAMSEYDMALAGQLRSRFGVVGMSAIVAARFTNKVAMKQALANSNISYPQFVRMLESKRLPMALPFIVKPHQGAASHGVHLITKQEDYDAFLASLPDLSGYEAESYIDQQIVHVDGIVQDGRVIFCKASHYIGTCLDYARGEALGSAIIDDQVDQAYLKSFTQEVLARLGLEAGVFHLEVFYELGSQAATFLEVGARQGGGEIVPLFKRLYGIDLIAAFFKTQVLETIHVVDRAQDASGGFLLIPESRQSVPCLVKANYPMKGTLQTLEVEILPQVGTVLDGEGGYYFNSGRFLFIGRYDQVVSDIQQAKARFRMDTDPVMNKETI